MSQVSVIIPTHNRLSFLGRAIKSVLAQTLKDFEILIVHNGETQFLKEEIQQYTQADSRIRYFYHPTASAANARNLGIQESRGEYVAFLDDDDEWFPEKLDRQVRVFEENAKIGLVSCRALKIDGQSTSLLPRKKASELSVKTLLTNDYIPSSFSCVMVRKACFQETGLLNVQYSICDDFDLYLRLASQFQLFEIEDSLVRYHWHQNNISNNEYELVNERVLILNQYAKSRQIVAPAQNIKNAIRTYARNYYSLAQEAFDSKQYFKAFKFVFLAIRLDPFFGLRLPWTRFSNPIYQFIRPYGFLVWTFFAFLRGFYGKN